MSESARRRVRPWSGRGAPRAASSLSRIRAAASKAGPPRRTRSASGRRMTAIWRPWRVRMISSPASTRLSSWGSVARASLAVTETISRMVRPCTILYNLGRSCSSCRVRSAVLRVTSRRTGPARWEPGGMSEKEERDGVPLTNLDQPLFDEAGATKRDLVDYLDGVSERILPGLRDRPLSVIRVHRGQKAFMQKNVPKYTPDWVPTVQLWAEASKRDVSYAVCNDRRTLLWFANQRAVEYHPTLVLADRLDHMTHLVLDLDRKSTRLNSSH